VGKNTARRVIIVSLCLINLSAFIDPCCTESIKRSMKNATISSDSVSIAVVLHRVSLALSSSSQWYHFRQVQPLLSRSRV